MNLRGRLDAPGVYESETLLVTLWNSRPLFLSHTRPSSPIFTPYNLSGISFNLLTLGGASVGTLQLRGNHKQPGVCDTQMLPSINYFDILIPIITMGIAILVLNYNICKFEGKNPHEMSPVLLINIFWTNCRASPMCPGARRPRFHLNVVNYLYHEL